MIKKLLGFVTIIYVILLLAGTALAAGAFSFPVNCIVHPSLEVVYVPHNAANSLHSYIQTSHITAPSMQSDTALGAPTYGMAISPAGDRLYVSLSNGASSNLVYYDLGAGGSIGTVHPFTGASWFASDAPAGVAVGPANLVFVVNQGTGMVRVFNSNTRAWIQDLTDGIGTLRNLYSIAVTPATVSSMTMPIPGGGSITYSVYNYKIYIARRIAGGEIYVLNCRTSGLTQTTTVLSNSVISGTAGLSWPSDLKVADGRLYVAVNDSSGAAILVYDTGSDTPVGTVTTSQHNDYGWTAFTFSADHNWIFLKKSRNAIESENSIYRIRTANLSSTIFVTDEVIASDGVGLIEDVANRVTFVAATNSHTGELHEYNTNSMAPPTIQDFLGTPGNHSASFTWTNPARATHVKIVRYGPTTNVPWPAINISGTPIIGVEIANLTVSAGSAGTYTDTGLINGQRYNYSIFPCDSNGVWNTFIDDMQPGVNASNVTPNGPNLPPSDFVKQNPTNGSFVNEGNVPFGWQASTNEAGYSLTYTLVLLDSNGTPLHTYSTTDHIYTVPAAEFTLGNTYFWNVSVNDGHGHTVWANGSENARYAFTYIQSQNVAKAPYIMSTSPTNGATSVASTANIVINFSETMNPASVLASLRVSPTLSNPVYRWSGVDGTTLTISHDAFAADTTYTVTVDSTAQDFTGQALTTSTGAPNPFHFSTGTGTVVLPNVPRNLMATKSGNDVILTWDAPSAGEPGGGYRVYRGTNPTAITTQVGGDVLPGTHTLTSPGDVSTSDSYYYVVRAFAGATTSDPSNMGYLLKTTFSPSTTAVSNIYWIAIPYHTNYINARDIANDINGIRTPGDPGTCVEVGKFDTATGITEALSWYGDIWYDTISANSNGFTILSGESYYIAIVGNTNWLSAGADVPSHAFNLTPVGTNIFWISLPYQANYSNARNIVDQINVGRTADNYIVPEIGKYNSDTGVTETLTWYGDAWYDSVAGNDQGFSFRPGEGYYISVFQPLTDWIPTRR